MVAIAAASSKFAYRPEIDGIRTLAVIAVIINHFNKDILSSGYLGVDIFFVLSGFVITLSVAGRTSKNFRDFITGFYTRRIKRLVPALVLFVAVNSVLICLFNPDPAESIETGISAMFGLSNLYLFKESTDYFAASTALNVFTHTWSLGVEEQFYFLFPLLFWLTGFSRSTQKGAQNLLVATSILCTASFLAFVQIYPTNQAAAYFLMPTRLWELGAGCLLFISLQRSYSWIYRFKNTSPLFITAILIAVMLAPVQFAVASTIAVVILTAVLILCLRTGTTAYQLFTHPVILYIGKLSYSLYLWHWSVLAISRWTIGIHWWSVPFQAALIFLLSAGSYRYVEKPLRHVRWADLRWREMGKGIAAATSLAFLLALVVKFPQLSAYAGQRPSIEATGVASLTEEYILENGSSQDSAGAKPIGEWKGYKCVLWGDSRIDKEISTANCTLGDFSKAQRRVLVLGDSFSSAFVQSFDQLVTSDNYAVTIVSSFGTSPVKAIPTQETTEAINNYYWDTVVPDLISQLSPNDWVLLINNLGGLSTISKSLGNSSKLQQLESGFGAIADQLANKSIRLAVLHGLPFTREPNCPPAIAAKQWFSPFGGPCEFPTRREALLQRTALDTVLTRLERQQKLSIIDLFDLYCPERQCTYNATNGQMLYRDEYGHPSVESARLSAPMIQKVLKTF